jgi:hypothetical protein
MRRSIVLSALSLLASVSFLAACASDENSSISDSHAATYASRKDFPAKLKTENSTNIGATIENGAKTLRVINYGNSSFSSVDIWVNSSFVYQADNIAPLSAVTMDLSKFYDRDGHPFTEHETRVNTVQVQLGDELWTLLGPITN